MWAQIALFYTDDAHAPDLTEYFKNDGPLPDVSARSGYDEIMAIVPKLVPKQKWSHSPYKGCKELNKLPHLGGSPWAPNFWALYSAKIEILILY